MDTDLLSLLVHPKYKTALQYDEASQQLRDPAHNDSFSIKEQVPVLLTKDEDAALLHTEAHDAAGSQFHYKEHYQADAETYDYFKESESGAEREEHKRLHQYILSELPKQADWVLDVGCGGGWLSKALKSRNKHVISMDILFMNHE